MAIAFTFVKKLRGKPNKVEVWKYTKLTGDTGPATLTANSLTSIQTIDTASGGSGTVTRDTSSAKAVVVDQMGAETSGVILLEGTDI